jgi:hypothetical protein
MNAFPAEKLTTFAQMVPPRIRRNEAPVMR